MSMQTWTTYAYGVMDDDITNISMNAVWPAFYNTERSFNSNIDTEFEEFCANEGVAPQTIRAYDNLDNADVNEYLDRFITEYYENHCSRVCSSANALVLAALVARFIGVDFSHVITETNEEGRVLVGIGLYYPWNTPDKLKNASQEDYEQAFINAYAILGIDGHDCAIEEQSLENWG